MQPNNRILFAYHLTWILILVILLVFRFDRENGFTSLIRFGQSWEEHRVSELKNLHYAVIHNQSGYDGQFYAQIALHPHLTDPELAASMDSVHYRARRIFLPALAFIVGLGQPFFILHLFAVFNVLCWFLLAWQLTRWLPPTSWENFGRWFFCVASAGVLTSLRSALTELPSLCLLLAAVRLWELNRIYWAGILMALTGLTRETAVLGGFFAADSPRHWRRILWFGVIGLAPVLLWSFYLHRLFPEGDRSSNNFSLPFVELLRTTEGAIQFLSKGIEDNGRYTFRLFAVAGFLIQCIVLLRIPQPKNLWWRMALPFILLLPFLGEPVWDGYWAVCRTLLPLTVAFNLLLPSNRCFWPLLLAANLPTTLHSIFRLAF